MNAETFHDEQSLAQAKKRRSGGCPNEGRVQQVPVTPASTTAAAGAVAEQRWRVLVGVAEFPPQEASGIVVAMEANPYEPPAAEIAGQPVARGPRLYPVSAGQRFIGFVIDYVVAMMFGTIMVAVLMLVFGEDLLEQFPTPLLVLRACPRTTCFSRA